MGKHEKNLRREVSKGFCFTKVDRLSGISKEVRSPQPEPGKVDEIIELVNAGLRKICVFENKPPTTVLSLFKIGNKEQGWQEKGDVVIATEKHRRALMFMFDDLQRSRKFSDLTQRTFAQAEVLQFYIDAWIRRYEMSP